MIYKLDVTLVGNKAVCKKGIKILKKYNCSAAKTTIDLVFAIITCQACLSLLWADRGLGSLTTDGWKASIK